MQIAHNAHLIRIEVPDVPLDVQRGITSSGPTLRWSGDMQARLEMSLLEHVRGTQRVTIPETVAWTPSNMPVVPNIEDLLTFKMLRDQSVQVLRVKFVEDRFFFLGQLRFTCRPS